MKTYFSFDGSIWDGYHMDNGELKIVPLQKENKVLFKEAYFETPSLPWEVRYDNSYPNVLYDEKAKLFRVYYTTIIRDYDSEQTPLSVRPHKDYEPRSDRLVALCYAESKDGIHWIKPNLSIHPFKGNKNNNIIMLYAHGAGVFLDEQEEREDMRYKLITKMEYGIDCRYMATAYSKDGIHFSKSKPWIKYNPAADTHNFLFRDKIRGTLTLITRIWKENVRIVAKSESSDFINWSEPKEILRGTSFEQQVYAMPIFQYKSLYFGLAAIYHMGDRASEEFDCVDCALQYAHNIDHFQEISASYFIPRGTGSYPSGAADCGCVYAGIPIAIENRLYFYYMGGNGKHTNYRETSFLRGYIEKDKFAYYTNKREDKEAYLYTNVFVISGPKLTMLVEEESDGYVELAICNKAHEVVDGLDFKDMRYRYENGYKVIEQKEAKFASLYGTSIRLKIRLKNARLYAIEGDIQCTTHRQLQDA